MDRDDALDRLLARFIASRGPVPIRDFARWSGLTLTESRGGLDHLRDRFAAIDVDGEPYWFDPELAETPSAPTSSVSRLIQMYDEWIMVYASLAPLLPAATLPGGMESPSVYAWEQAVTVGGLIVGCWSRAMKRKSVAVTVTIYPEFAGVDRDPIAQEAERYAAYLERALDLTIAAGPAKPA